ncbi:MAG: CoA-binding protein, partial [Candidatus Korarchaeota archaeon]|nr:CoA-binding protein [Candidatus Korarchaeota archaeon]
MGELDVFFKPRSVAVIGASRNPERVGHVILKRLIEIGFPGGIYPVNPKADQILGLNCYPRVSDIPGDIDLAVIALRADLTPSALEEAAEKGAKGAIVVSGGFSEIGNEQLERKLLEVAKRHGVRVIGPNCLGVFDPKDRIDTLFLPEEVIPRPRPGEVSIITQSGSLGSTLL